MFPVPSQAVAPRSSQAGCAAWLMLLETGVLVHLVRVLCVWCVFVRVVRVVRVVNGCVGTFLFVCLPAWRLPLSICLVARPFHSFACLCFCCDIWLRVPFSACLKEHHKGNHSCRSPYLPTYEVVEGCKTRRFCGVVKILEGTTRKWTSLNFPDSLSAPSFAFLNKHIGRHLFVESFPV